MILRRGTESRLCGAAAATAVLGLLAGLLTAGCGPKEAAAPPAAPQTAPAGGAPAPDVKLTPEQEAAKQRAIQQGPAIEAALKRQQGQ